MRPFRRRAAAAAVSAALVAVAAPLRASQDVPAGLQVSFEDGKLAVTAKDRSVREIFTSVAHKAGFKLEGADLLPEERVTVVMTPGPAFREIPNLLGLAPKLNYIVVYGDEAANRHQVVKVALFPREGGKEGLMVVGSGAAGAGGNTYTPPPQPPPLPLPPPPGSAPVYQPPETTPVYIPPETPPVYIPPDSPPQYIPADGPPQYIPPAPPPPTDPSDPPQKPAPPPGEEPQ